MSNSTKIMKTICQTNPNTVKLYNIFTSNNIIIKIDIILASKLI